MTKSTYMPDADFCPHLLGRMKSDCDYYLGYGQRDASVLWVKGDIKGHLDSMRKFYNSLPEGTRVDFLSEIIIKEYERKMLSQVGHLKELPDGSGCFEGWQYHEKAVFEESTGKQFTLTQPERMLEEDTYHITRCLAIEDVSVDVVPERPFYVYEIVYMPDGYSSREVFVSEDFLVRMLKKYCEDFLHGTGNEVLKNCLSNGGVV